MVSKQFLTNDRLLVLCSNSECELAETKQLIVRLIPTRGSSFDRHFDVCLPSTVFCICFGQHHLQQHKCKCIHGCSAPHRSSRTGHPPPRAPCHGHRRHCCSASPRSPPRPPLLRVHATFEPATSLPPSPPRAATSPRLRVRAAAPCLPLHLPALPPPCAVPPRRPTPLPPSPPCDVLRLRTSLRRDAPLPSHAAPASASPAAAVRAPALTAVRSVQPRVVLSAAASYALEERGDAILYLPSSEK